MKTWSFKATALSGLLLAGLLMTGGCQRNEDPVKIGFLGVLSGRGAPLGISGRNAVQLAVDEANAAGGIRGRKVELVVKDSAMRAEVTRTALDELKRRGVVAVIGPMTSSMGVEAVRHAPLMPLISPTVATHELSGRKDNFFRVYPDQAYMAQQLTEHLCEGTNLRRFAILSDEGNHAFTQPWVAFFTRGLKRCNGEVVRHRTFQTRPLVSFKQLVGELASPEVEAVFILANATDTALIAQQIAMRSAGWSLVGSEWSSSAGMVAMGGAAVEGMSWMQGFPLGRKSARFERFSTSYREMFGQAPDFSASYAYEASQLLLKALAESPPEADLLGTLQAQRTFEGLYSPLTLNASGDVERPLYLTTIRQGKPVPAGS